jgi:hypothetical protein
MTGKSRVLKAENPIQFDFWFSMPGFNCQMKHSLIYFLLFDYICKILNISNAGSAVEMKQMIIPIYS